MSRFPLVSGTFGALALAAAIAGCSSLTGLLSSAPSPSPDGPPSFESLVPSRHATSAADNRLTFTVDASAPGQRAITYTWEASDGTLSTKQGRTVTWTAADVKGGKLAEGAVVLTVTASDGAYQVSRDITLSVDANGIATLPITNFTEGPASTPPTAGPTTSTTTGTATGTATSTPAVACHVVGATPALASAGSLVYVTGQGFSGNPSVSIGGQAAQVVAVKPQWIAALVPAGATGGTPLDVSVQACGATQTAGKVLVGSEDAFAAPSTQPGQGLLVQVYQIPDSTTQLPDLSAETPVTSFVASTIAVPTATLAAGISTATDPITDDFALRYTGQLNIDAAGFTNFALTSQDGARLLIDGSPVVNDDGVHGSPTAASGSANLSRGLHTFELDYFNVSGGNVTLTLKWSTPGGLSGAIPASALQLPATLGS